MSRSYVFALFVVLFVACKEKEPYKARFMGLPDAVEQQREVKQSVDVAVPPPAPLQAPQSPLAIIVTFESTYLLTSTKDGRVVEAKKLPWVSWVRNDGTLISIKPVSETKKPCNSCKESVFASLILIEGGKERKIAQTHPEPPDIKAAIKADPDLAPSMYHRERFELFAMYQSFVTFVYRMEQYLGGVHPTAQSTIVTVDLEKGEVVSFMPKFSGRDLALETDDRTTGIRSCVRRPVGVAPVGAWSGDRQWVVALAHEFELCAGALRIAPIREPGMDQGPPVIVSPAPSANAYAAFGRGDLGAPGMAAWRYDEDTNTLVYLAGLSADDKTVAPWQSDYPDRRLREIRVSALGASKEAVIGRASNLLEVQFLYGRERSNRLDISQ